MWTVSGDTSSKIIVTFILLKYRNQRKGKGLWSRYSEWFVQCYGWTHGVGGRNQSDDMNLNVEVDIQWISTWNGYGICPRTKDVQTDTEKQK